MRTPKIEPKLEEMWWTDSTNLTVLRPQSSTKTTDQKFEHEKWKNSECYSLLPKCFTGSNQNWIWTAVSRTLTRRYRDACGCPSCEKKKVVFRHYQCFLVNVSDEAWWSMFQGACICDDAALYTYQTTIVGQKMRRNKHTCKVTYPPPPCHERLFGLYLERLR